MAGQHGAADLELTLHCLLQFTDRSRSIFPDKRRVRPHVPELRGDYPLRYVPPGFSELLFGFCPVGIVDIPIAHELIKPDRKSTRLNSSHVAISYAVFCLKK